MGRIDIKLNDDENLRLERLAKERKTSKAAVLKSSLYDTSPIVLKEVQQFMLNSLKVLNGIDSAKADEIRKEAMRLCATLNSSTNII